uniref:Peptidase S1 domain-containing protein n=1 Tax=Pelusios castaneus TaxID=367368 RepID=A0A8C8RYH2_9SAUR
PELLLLILLLFSRVIGGHEATPSSRPYMAYVQIGSAGGCGGFLIREDVVVTAAHCNCNLCNIFVYLGVQDFMDPGQNWQRIQARRWVQHPDFNNENFENDIMLVKLSHSVELTEWVGTVPLPEADHPVWPGSKCSMAGWGRTGPNSTTDRLQEVDQKVVPDKLCKERYRHYNPSTMLCAGSPHEKKAAFTDDSGGPLVCDGLVQGIVSNGDRAGRRSPLKGQLKGRVCMEPLKGFRAEYLFLLLEKYYKGSVLALSCV